MNTRKNIAMALIFLVSGLLGFAVYSRFFAPDLPTGNVEEDDKAAIPGDAMQQKATSSSTVQNEIKKEPQANAKKKTTIASGAPVKKPAVVNSELSLPDLTVVVINDLSLSDEQRQEYTKRMQHAAEEIKNDNEVYDNLLDLASYRKLVKDYDGAENLWLYMERAYPLRRESLENLGNLYHFYKKDLEQAEAYMKKAIALEPHYPYAYVNLFELYTMSYTDKKNMGEQTLLDGLKSIPNAVLLELTLAKFYDEEGRDAEAKTRYEKVLGFAQQAGDTGLAAQVSAALENL